MIFNEQLTPRDVQTVLSCLGIDINDKRTDQNGWITINSPLREDNNPSFGLNIQKGSWKDHGTGQKGDIVTLIEKLKGFDNDKAIKFVKRITHADKHHTRIPANRTLKNSFWNNERKQLLLDAQKKLKDQPNHPVIQKAKDYDQLSHEILLKYGCGVVKAYKHNWLAMPYYTGCQLYRRENGEKVIRNMKGSVPSDSFFGIKQFKKDRDALFIAKSPRETMLISDVYSSIANVIGLTTGEQANLSKQQQHWLKGELTHNNYKDVILLLDCDSITAHEIAKKLADNCKKLAINTEAKVSYINITEFTNGENKDLTDFVQSGNGNKQLTNLFESRTTIYPEKSAFKNIHAISPDDLMLSDSLIDLLPETLRDFLNYSSPLSDVPNEFLITPFLAVCGAVIGKKRYAKVGAIVIYPTIWTVLFAGSSTLRKSTALRLAKEPFKPIMERFSEQYEKDLTLWKQMKDFFEKEGEDFDDPEPFKRTIYCPDGFSDLTFWQSLRDNGSIISTPSEFTSLWSELTRPRNSMRDMALSIFDAEDSIRRTTHNAGDIELNNPVWCIAGATTLENFQRTLTSNERSSGLLQRILPVYMEKPTKQFKALTELQNQKPALYEKITHKVSHLVDLSEKPVEISYEAEKFFTEWSHGLNDRAEQLSNRLTDIGGYTSRLNVYGLKFALIFQQLDKPHEFISKRNMIAAIKLCEWLFTHIIYMLDRNYIFNRYYADRVKLREITMKQPNKCISRTDLMNLSNFDKEQLDRAVNTDIDAGIIEEIKVDTGGRPRIEYKLLS